MSDPAQRAVLGSVVIPAFNAERFLPESVTSVLASIDHCASTLDAFHSGDMTVVVVDDGSTDKTADVIRRLAEKDRRVVPVLGRSNGGAGPARNAGAAAADGALLFFLDADDCFLPNHIAGALTVLLADPSLGFCQGRIAMPEPVHPEWQEALERSVVFNLAVWKCCHDFIGGFLEDPHLKVLRCEDVLYRRALFRWFAGSRGPEALGDTVRHSRHAGNAFDRQQQRFALEQDQADAEGLSSLDPQEAEAWPHIFAAEQRRIRDREATAEAYDGMVPLLRTASTS